MNKVIELKNVSISYESKVVLKDVSLTVYEKDFIGLIGPNGGGKTTLIKTIMGLKSHFEGTIKFYHNGKEVPRITIGYLPQYNSIDKRFPISIRETILSGLNSRKSIFRRFKAEHYQLVEQTIIRMGLEGLGDRAIGELSGGQLQRALLGRAIISNPDVIILDEPSTYIDKKFENKLYEMLDEINKTCAIILISHDIGGVIKQVKSIAGVNETVYFHPNTEVSIDLLNKDLAELRQQE